MLGTGLALAQAMLRVSDGMEFIYPKLAAEFYTVVLQVKAGRERATAYEHPERAFRHEPVAAGIKMLFPIVLFILPALFVITLVPGVLSVLHDLKQGFGPPR